MRTLGQPTAPAAVRALLATGFPHAVLLSGPAGTGKTYLAMALAVRSAQAGSAKGVVRLLGVTAALGAAFLAVKGYEYHSEWTDGLVPALHFTYAGAHRAGVEAFFSLYFLMTGLHALHLAIGIGIVGWVAWKAHRGAFDSRYHDPVEVTGLYWHFVDCVWVFLYPLFYLMGLSR